jgi:endonuclease-3
MSPTNKPTSVKTKASKPGAKSTGAAKANASAATAKANARAATAASPKTGASLKAATKPIAGQKKNSDGIDEKFKKVPAHQAREMLKILSNHYPDAQCELFYGTTFQLIIAVILSAQTTDVGVNKCTPTLFKRFPDAKALAEADLDEIKGIIKPTGFFNAKATNIQRCAQALVERFGGEVPHTLEELTTLPGVGRKTANVVLGVAYGEPAWTVDTHVQRLSRRLGLSDEEDPVKIEFALQKLFPGEDWSKYSITIIWHGRRICFARKPDCPGCPINHLCPSSQI